MRPGQQDAQRQILEIEAENLSLAERLMLLADKSNRPVFTTSLGIEDQVLTAALTIVAPSVRIVTLETGRLFEETKALIAETEARFGIVIERFRPDEIQLKNYADKFGLNGFYDSVEARHACCGVRKLEPLARTLEGADLWITGLRRDQSNTRSKAGFTELDAQRGLLKANPLYDWSIEDVHRYIADNDVPINALHARGYPSIGCEPCTRAIKKGEDERAGRWWWENDQQRECGLHVTHTAGDVRENAPDNTIDARA